MPSSAAGGFSVVRAPWLHALRVTRHDNEIGEPAAALGAAELEILHRHIAATAVDDGPEVSCPCMLAAPFAPHTHRHRKVCGSMVRAVGKLSVMDDHPERVAALPHSIVITTTTGICATTNTENAMMIPYNIVALTPALPGCQSCGARAVGGGQTMWRVGPPADRPRCNAATAAA